MRSRISQIMVTWYCLAVSLLIGVVPAEGFVLCFGSDGHIEVSSPASGCDGCSEQALPAEGKSCLEEVGNDADQPCCPCLDVPVIAESDVVGQKLPRLFLERFEFPLATLPALELPRERSSDLARLGPPPPAPSSFTISQLRSIILLI
ncbi:hypothetical protein BH23PLA1_BH23PLA1_12200 [soil metagenome]